MIYLQERRRLREGHLKEESIDVDSSACSSGLFTFNRPTKASSSIQKKSEKNRSNDNHTGGKPHFSERQADFEKMDEDEADADTSSDKFTKTSESSKPVLRKGIKRPASSDVDDCSGHLKQKLDIKDVTDDNEMTGVSEETGFKSRKFSKKNIRSRQKQDDEDE